MSNNRKKNVFAFVVVFLFFIFYFIFSIPIKAAETLKYEFPGDYPSSQEIATSPAAYIARFYQFALMIAGMLAFGMLIYGGIKYTVSRGNTAQIADAKDIIYQALWGVALLLGAYLILFTIDSGLVSLKDPKIDFLKTEKTTTPTTWKEPTQYSWVIPTYESGLYLCPAPYPVSYDDSFCEKSGLKPDIFYKCCGK